MGSGSRRSRRQTSWLPSRSCPEQRQEVKGTLIICQEIFQYLRVLHKPPAKVLMFSYSLLNYYPVPAIHNYHQERPIENKKIIRFTNMLEPELRGDKV